uniref:Uncharacterized protein n=1 Tax=Megaselia scalaris TaxID=36166 RepID=T1GUL9_MEGSC
YVRYHQIGRIRDTLRSINERYRNRDGNDLTTSRDSATATDNNIVMDFEEEEVLDSSDGFTTNEDSLHTSDVETLESMEEDGGDVMDYDENLTGEHKYLEEMERVP